MKRLHAEAFALMLFIAAVGGTARAQYLAGGEVTVSGRGRVIAPPDLGILIMEIYSSAPLAADAATENGAKSRDIVSALNTLGYGADEFKLSPVVFTRDNGPANVAGQAMGGNFQAEQFIYLFFGSDELKNPSDLGQKVGAVFDALAKKGAVAAAPYMQGQNGCRVNLPTGMMVSNSYSQQQAPMLIYTVRDPAKYEGEALQRALDQARDSTLHSVGTTVQGARTFGTATGIVLHLTGALADLPYRYYSTCADQVEISASVSLNYSFN